MTADVSKTVRFTPQAWKRWSRLIGVNMARTWADVVNVALIQYERRLVDAGMMTAYKPAEGEYPTVEPTLIDLFEQDQAAASSAELVEVNAPDTTVHGTGVCGQCGKGKRGAVPLNKIGLCAGCELVRHSGGSLTTGDKLPTPAKAAARTTSPAKKPTAEKRTTAAAKKPTAEKRTTAAAKKGGKS